MKIEKMRLDDLAAIVKLAEQLGYPGSLQEMKIRFVRMTDSRDHALFVARSDSDHILGYIQVNREPHTLLADPRAEVAALVVDQTIRSKGIGTALLHQAEAWAKENHLSLIRIRSNTKRTEAHKFYLKNGYQIPKSWHLFTKNP